MRPNRTRNIDWWTWPIEALVGHGGRFILFLSIVGALPATSFPAPFLKDCELFVSVDDVADVWLNGVPILESQKITLRGPDGIEPQKVDPCLFKADNLLAVRDADNNPTSAMVAFLLKARMSDGTLRVFSSRDTQGIRSFYVGNPRSPEPGAWWLPGYEDGSWTPPTSLGAFSSYLSLIEDTDSKVKPLFISSTDNSGKTLVDGERHLFRGAFHWDLSVNPTCVPPTPTLEPIHSTAPLIPARLAYVPPPIPTSTPRPVVLWVPPTPTPIRFRPTATSPPLPTATRWVPRPTATFFVPTATRVVLKPTPRRPIRAVPTVPWRKFGPTPTVRFSGDIMVTGPRQWVPPTETFTPLPRVVAVVTLVPTAAPHPDAMVFDQLPVAIHVSLADGPGDYSVDLYSETGSFLMRVFEKKVSGDLEDWVEWDGMLEDRRAPSGTYLFVCRKGDRELKRIWIVLKTNR